MLYFSVYLRLFLPSLHSLFLPNRPLFAATKQCKSAQKYLSTKLEIKSKQILKQVLLVVWLLICSLLRTFAQNILRTMLKVEIINRSHHALPTYATPLSAGMDLRANLTEPIVLKPLARCIVPTGLFIALPEGYEAQVRPRSGLAIKKGITVLNSPGTVDADYRGEVGVILVNLSSEDFVIEDGERIAQMVIARHEQVEWEAVEVLSETERGAGGFGHTGV